MEVKESAALAYQNHPVKFTVYIFDIDITHDIENYGNIEASLDYPQITEYRIGEANFTLRDYDEDGNVGQKYNPEYEGNFFGQYGLQSGYKSPVRIEVHFLVDGELKSSVNPTSADTEKLPIILFEGKILSVNKGLKAGTIDITCSDLTQDFRTKNADNFGIPKEIALTKGDSNQRSGDYPIPYLLTPISEDSLIPIEPLQLTEVDRLKTTGQLNKYNYTVSDQGIQLEDGHLDKEVKLDEKDEDGVQKTTREDVNPKVFFKSPFRNKRVEDLVKKVVAHYNLGNAEIEVPRPKLGYHFFTNMGRVGYDFDKKDERKKFRWEGFVTDFIYGRNLAAFNDPPFDHSRADKDHDDLSNARGLADSGNHFFTIKTGDNLGRNTYLYSINPITGRASKIFEFEDSLGTGYKPVLDGLIFFDDRLLILSKNNRGYALFSADPFKLNPSNRVPVTPISGLDIGSQTNQGGLPRSLVSHDEKLFLVKENGLYRIDLDENNGTLIKISHFTGDTDAEFGEGPRLTCAVSYNGDIYGIGQKGKRFSNSEDSKKSLYRINHYSGIAREEYPLTGNYSDYSPRALNTYQGILYSLVDETTIEEVTIGKNPYTFSTRDIYENSKGDKLFFLYSSRLREAIPKIIEYDIKTDTYTEIYSHHSGGEGINRTDTRAEFWKIASGDYKTFYILGTEPPIGRDNDEFGIYNVSDANYGAPSTIKIWKFDRVTLEFDPYIEHDTDPITGQGIEFEIIPRGKAPPQLGHYYHGFDIGSGSGPIYPDSRKNFQVINKTLYYLWATNRNFGVAKASGDTPYIERIFLAGTDQYYNTCGCDFTINESSNTIYAAFTFVNTIHGFSTISFVESSI